MHVVVFSYNREEMLGDLLREIMVQGYEGEQHKTTVIDDGSEWSKELNLDRHDNIEIIKTHHEGKMGFWKKWVMARQIVLGSDSDYFLFLPDDVKDVDFETIKAITEQGWDDSLFAVNVINCGRTECWGQFLTGQEDIEINDKTLFETGFVDCGFLTNRYTLEHIDIYPVKHEWFDRDDKSSGVGHQMTQSLRHLGTKMMSVREGLCYHGDHESQMHGKFREQTPLTSK